MLQHEVASLDGVDAKYHPLYTEKEGKFLLDPEVQEDTSGLKSTIASLKQQKIDVLKPFTDAGVTVADLPEIGELRTQAQKLKDKKLIDSGDFETLVASRMKPLEDRLAATESRNQEQEQRIHTMTTTDKIQGILIAKGNIADKSVPDWMARVQNAGWIDHEGQPGIMNGSGVLATASDGTVLHGEAGILSWANSLKSDAPHLFKTSSGGGAGPGSGKQPPTDKQINRTTFDGMNDAQRRAHLSDGGTVVD